MKVWVSHRHILQRFLGLKKAWAFVCLILALGCTPKLRVGAKSEANGTTGLSAAPSALTLISPATNPGTSATPTIRVSGVVSGDTVAIYTDSACSVGNLKASGVASGTTIDLVSSSLAVGSYTFYARSTDPAGNASSCSVASASYQRGTAASLSITSHVSPYNFGNVPIGNSASMTFTVSNAGGVAASSIVFSGYSGVYSRGVPAGTNCGATLTAGTTCQLRIDFVPAGISTVMQTLNLAYNDGDGGSGSYNFTLSGTGITPANITLSSSDLDFGTTVGGVESDAITLTLTNSGQATATSLSIDTMSDFIYSSGSYPGTATNPCGVTLAGGATCNMRFTFRPGVENGYLSGMRYQNPNLSYHDGATTQTLNPVFRGRSELIRVATGRDYRRSAEFATGILDFGTVYHGRTNYRILTLINPTDRTVPIVATITSQYENFYSFAGGAYPGSGGPGNTPGKSPCGASLLPNASCELIIQFSPFTPASISVFNSGLSITTSIGGLLIARVDFTGTETFAPTCACNPADSVSFGGGSGSAGDPYQICSAAHLQRMDTAFALNAGWTGTYFTQCDDIDVATSGLTLASIGRTSGGSFHGVYDGNFYEIRNLVSNQSSCNPSDCSSPVTYFGDGGLFYRLTGSVKNVFLFNATIAGIPENQFIDFGVGGGIAKFSMNDNLIHIDNSVVTGTISGRGSLGGIIGQGGGIRNSFSTAGVSSTGADLWVSYGGGLIGEGGTVESSYSTGAISCLNPNGFGAVQTCGGLVAIGAGIKTSFFAGRVTNIDGPVGGIIGSQIAGYIAPVSSYADETSYTLFNFGSVIGSGSVGGIVGSQSYGLEGVHNYGAVSGSSQVGGISGSSTATIEYARSYGNISTSTSAWRFGGIVGFFNSISARVRFSEVDAAITIPVGLFTEDIGGIAGRVLNINSFNSNTFYGSIDAQEPSATGIGGLVGGGLGTGTVQLVNSISMARAVNVASPYGPCLGRDDPSSSVPGPTATYWSSGVKFGVSPPNYSSMTLHTDQCNPVSDFSALSGDPAFSPAYDFTSVGRWLMPGPFYPDLPALETSADVQ